MLWIERPFGKIKSDIFLFQTGSDKRKEAKEETQKFTSKIEEVVIQKLAREANC